MRGDFEIYTWPGGARSAATIFFDDCWQESVQKTLPLLKKHKISANFAVIAGLLGKKFEGRQCIPYAALSQLRTAGHEISSHTLTHARLDELRQHELKHELSESRRILSAETIAYPYDRHNYRVRRAAKQHYLAARARRDRINESTPRDFSRLNAFASVSSTAPEMNFWADEAGGKWLIETHHLLGKSGTYKYYTEPHELDSHLSYLASSGFWINTAANVAKYIIARDNSKIEAIGESAKTITLRAVPNAKAAALDTRLSFGHGGKIHNIRIGETMEIGK